MSPSCKVVVPVPKLGIDAHFFHRRSMDNPHPLKRAKLPAEHANWTPPVTVLPVDSSGNGAVSCPMDGNDVWGDCGEVMVAHVDSILTFRQGAGTQSVWDVTALVDQYKTVSGGDNGLDEDMVVNRIWKVGIAGNPKAVIVDALDIDVANVPLARFCIDNFYTVQMAWSVPNAFIDNFRSGSIWPSPMTPNPMHGHYTPLSDVAGPISPQSGIEGFYRLWTWGGFGWVAPAMVASVQPQCFVAFSPRQFDLTSGRDSKGRHISAQAALWSLMGGNPIPLSVINAFPPAVGPPVPQPPQPVPPVPQPLFHLSLPAMRKGQHVRFQMPVDLPAPTVFDCIPSSNKPTAKAHKAVIGNIVP